jgi:hypothetical protein
MTAGAAGLPAAPGPARSPGSTHRAHTSIGSRGEPEPGAPAGATEQGPQFDPAQTAGRPRDVATWLR